MLNLQDVAFTPRSLTELADEDRWILSRLSVATAEVTSALEAYNPSAALAAARDFFWSELCDWYLEWIKPRMRDAGQAPMARQVLAVAIDHVLRLLHPFVPFLTERLWEALNDQAPIRGIDTELPASAGLIHAAWPSSRPDWRDEAIEAQIVFWQDVIRAIRDIRSKYTISPQTQVPARIRATEGAALSLQSGAALLQTMAGLESIEIAPELQRSPDAATAVVGAVEVYIPGVIDPEKERGRLTKQREQLLKKVEGSRRKLSNDNFLSKASPEVVQKERDRLAESEAEMDNVEAALAALG
jgi:valyl-tRNA synthetase